MFKNMKLGAKIGTGFAALIVIALSLGGLAVWNMTAVKTVATELSVAKVPQVQLATDVERDSLQTMYATRGYAFTEEKSYLEQARKQLGEVRKGLQACKDHADKYDIALLKQNEQKASAKVTEYEALLNDTVAKTEAMDKDIENMTIAAGKYMTACNDYLGRNQKDMEKAIKEAKMDEISQLNKEMIIVNDIIDLGNAIRIGNWKSQTQRDPKIFLEAQKKFDDVNKKLDEIKAGTTDPADIKQIEECRAAGKAYNDGMTTFLTNWLAREELGKKRNDVAQAVLAAAQDTSTAGGDEVAKSASDAAGSLSTASTTMIIGLSIGVLVGIILAIFITRSITGPLNRIIAGLSGGAEQTAAAAGQVSGASQSLAQGASEQAAAIEETTSSVEEMSSMTKQNAANANEAKSLAASARSSADKGAEAMTRMSQAIDDIKKSSDSTAKIIKTIDEIAFQTNLLALNAAVEAARAGEAGKGFAVVAEEVRNLAMRSAEAAKNTANMIEESVKNSNNGVQISKEVGASLGEIAEGSRKVNDLVGEIAAASSEQAQGIEQISNAVGQMDSVTQQNAANAEESASASEELSAQAEELNKMVAELQNMVGGSNRTAATTTRKAHHNTTTGNTTGGGHTTTGTTHKPTLEQQMPGGIASPRRKAALSNAEATIPMNDGELSKF